MIRKQMCKKPVQKKGDSDLFFFDLFVWSVSLAR